MRSEKGRTGKDSGSGKGGSGSTISRLDDGTLCIGDGCTKIRVPPKGNIQIDVSDCPDEVKGELSKRIIEGGEIEWDGRKKK